jgi:hypothetical protein
MSNSWKSFAVGAISMLVFIVAGYMVFTGADKNFTTPKSQVESPENLSNMVTITPLPSLRIIRGNDVPFEGTIELRQAVAGRFAQNIDIINFQATGEHAEKSVIKIVWENGEIEKVSAGTKDKKFAPDRRASAISVLGYSMHERRIFRDSSRKGTLTWEVRYEPVE